MDIFDGARVVLRWWFVVVPILILTVSAALFVTSDIQPEYRAEASVLLVGPAVRESPNAPGEFDALNPLLDQPAALETVATVLALSMQGPEVTNLLAEEGLSTAYVLGTDRGAPIVLLETRARSRDVALRTAERLAELIDEEVRLRQLAGDVPDNEQATTSVVQLGAVGGADYGGRSQQRILIGALGFGLAIGTAFFLEGIRQRRLLAMQNDAESESDGSGLFDVDESGSDDADGAGRSDVDESGSDDADGAGRSDVDESGSDDADGAGRSDVDESGSDDADGAGRSDVDESGSDDADGAGRSDVDESGSDDADGAGRSDVDESGSDDADGAGRSDVDESGPHDADPHSSFRTTSGSFVNSAVRTGVTSVSHLDDNPADWANQQTLNEDARTLDRY